MLVEKNKKRGLVAYLAILVGTFSGYAQVDYDFKLDVVGAVSSMALTPDGKVLVGGELQVPRVLNSDGTHSLTLDSKGISSMRGSVLSFAVQPDGKFVVAGDFESINQQSCRDFARFLPNGDVDTSFHAPSVVDSGRICVISTDSFDRLLVGGVFSSMDGVSITNLARLEPDGTLDTTFTTHLPSVAWVFAMQADGKVLVCTEHLSRLGADGSIDPGFNCPPDPIFCVTPQADGKILVSGNFNDSLGQTTNYLRRLHGDGTTDTTFQARVNSRVNAMSLQTDGKILIGGGFTEVNGTAAQGLCRLNPDGTLDSGFSAPAYERVYSMALQKDGKILVGSESSLDRLHNTYPATEKLSSEGSSITWMRGGAGPEVSRVLFQYSTNGVQWMALPAPKRILGGWKLEGLSLAPEVQIRARGWVSAGQVQSSSWFVQSLAQVSSSNADRGWIRTSAPLTNWTSVACSADGSKIVAASCCYGLIYVSTNSGVTWNVSRAPLTNYSSVAMSADGTRIIANTPPGVVFVSTNGGTDWTTSVSPAGQYQLRCSADGMKCVAASPAGVLTSTDGGLTWNFNTNRPLIFATISADGNTLAGRHLSGEFFTSTNGGVSWETAAGLPQAYTYFAGSADLRKVVAIVGVRLGPEQNCDYIYTSPDFGATWLRTSLPYGCYFSVVSSADGTKLAAQLPWSAQGTPIYTSTDSGATWTPNLVPGSETWGAVAASMTGMASSADGNLLVALAYGAGIHTRRTTPTPILKAQVAGQNLVLSWIVPSMDFVLQESSDMVATDWQDVAATPWLNYETLEYQLAVARGPATKFYRLALRGQ